MDAKKQAHSFLVELVKHFDTLVMQGSHVKRRMFSPLDRRWPGLQTGKQGRHFPPLQNRIPEPPPKFPTGQRMQMWDGG